MRSQLLISLLLLGASSTALARGGGGSSGGRGGGTSTGGSDGGDSTGGTSGTGTDASGTSDGSSYTSSYYNKSPDTTCATCKCYLVTVYKKSDGTRYDIASDALTGGACETACPIDKSGTLIPETTMGKEPWRYPYSSSIIDSIEYIDCLDSEKKLWATNLKDEGQRYSDAAEEAKKNGVERVVGSLGTAAAAMGVVVRMVL